MSNHGKALWLLLALALALASPVFASAPYQVADLNPSSFGVASQPVWCVRLDNIVFFQTHSTGSLPALWRTDGTPDGTFKLLSLRKPSSSSLLPIFGMVSSGNAVYFDAYDGDGRKVWKSDGTTADTVPITPVLSDSLGVMAVIGTRVLCRVAATGDLLAVDSSGAKQIGTAGFGSEAWISWTTFQGRLYVGTPSGLWRSDGTSGGTSKVSSMPAWNLVSTDSGVFFIGSSTAAGVEPWFSDGTAAGTRMIADLKPGTDSTFRFLESAMARLDGSRVMFLGSNGELGVSDGSSSGTRAIRAGIATRTLAANFGLLNGSLYFPFDDGVHGRQLWRSDGTDAGTVRVSDMTPRVDTYFYPIVAGSTRVYFYSQGPNLRELFESDGTTAGTHIVHQPPAKRWSGSSFSVPTIATVGDVAFFSAADTEHGDEPWITDGTDAGTHMIANVEPDTAAWSSPDRFFVGADRLYVSGSTDEASVIWRTDGTAAGTVPVLSAPVNQLPEAFAAAGNTLFLKRPFELWKTDGTPGGYSQIKTFATPLSTGGAAVVDGRVYFSDGNIQLWASDGTSAGTVQITTGFDQTNSVVNLAGRAHFVTGRGTLYATDGTVAGTRSLTEAAGSRGNIGALTAFGGALFTFEGRQETREYLLWRFATSAGDATILHHFPGDSFCLSPVTAVIGTSMLFSWRDSTSRNEELWKTDGTAGGTVLVKSFAATIFTSIDKMVSLGNKAVFTADDGIHGKEPWVSDGTPEGTQLLRDIGPGALQAANFGFTVADGIAYFDADDGVHGTELWETDGTPGGTQLVADIEPGAGGSSPASLTRFGDLLYFSAQTTASGRELWAYPLSQPAVTIDDARASESDRQIVVPIRLTHAAGQRVTVSYATADGSAKAGTDYTPASGSVTFEPGETAKSITVAVIDDAKITPTRSFFVTINAAAIRIEHTAAAAIIEDDDALVDVSVSVTPTTTQPLVSVHNAGPSAASNLRLCFAVLPAFSALVCDGPMQLAAGETYTRLIQAFGTQVLASATQFERDSNPANNAATWIASTSNYSAMYVTPPSLRVGETGTISVMEDRAPGTQATVALTSSDPSVISVPASLTIPGDATTGTATFQALKIGTATITATTDFTHVAPVRVVGASEPRRTSATLTIEAFSAWDFGRANALSATVSGIAANGARPTGSVSFFDDGTLIRTVLLANQIAETTVSDLKRLGFTHAITARYSGDANFLDTLLPASANVFFGGGVASFGAVVLPGTQNVLIVARGLSGYPPAGTITVLENDTTPRNVSGDLTAAGTDSSQSTALAVSASARTITVTYSGDPHYRPNRVTIPITRPRTHAAH